MATQSPPERLRNPTELAELIGVDPQLLAEWRSRRVGPPYLKLGHRTVRYRSSDVERWLASRKVSGGSDAA